MIYILIKLLIRKKSLNNLIYLILLPFIIYTLYLYRYRKGVYGVQNGAYFNAFPDEETWYKFRKFGKFQFIYFSLLNLRIYSK